MKVGSVAVQLTRSIYF